MGTFRGFGSESIYLNGPHMSRCLESSRTSQMDSSGLRGHVESIRSSWTNIVQICLKTILGSPDFFQRKMHQPSETCMSPKGPSQPNNDHYDSLIPASHCVMLDSNSTNKTNVEAIFCLRSP